MDELVDLLSGEDIAGAWIFGSAAEGHVRVGSDIDLGILFRESPTLDVLSSLRAALQKALRVEDVDVVSLNRASPTLRFEALRGKRLVCHDQATCAEFASLAAREYEDEMAMCERALAQRSPAALARVAEGKAPYGESRFRKDEA